MNLTNMELDFSDVHVVEGWKPENKFQTMLGFVLMVVFVVISAVIIYSI